MSPSPAAEPARPPLETHEDIVFYDGTCGLCDGFVQWLLAHDRRKELKIAALQGETAARLVGAPEGDPKGWSLILHTAEGKFSHSDAVLETAKRMGRPWSLLHVFRWVPRPLRDAIYRLVARHRYRFFGKREACRLPTPEEVARFLP